MPTSKQIKERAALISEFAEQVKEHGPSVIKSFEYKYRTDVTVLALARGYITVRDIAPKKAREVAEKILKKQPDRIRDESAAIGTAVHEILERLALGEIFDIDPELQGHANAWFQFKKDWKIRIVKTEFVVESVKHNYMGCGDVLFYSETYPELGLILGDYKSSLSGIWPDIALQLAAIAYADHILDCKVRPHDDDYEHKPEDVEVITDLLPQINSFVGIQVTGDGYKVVPVKVNKTTFDVFRAAQIVAFWTTDLKEKALEKAEFVSTVSQ